MGKEKLGESNKEYNHAIERIRSGLLLPMAECQQKSIMHTIAEVKEKLEAELKIYRDGDSKYVVEKLIELCRTDQELLEAIMLPSKSYDKAFQYFFEQSRSVGYRMPHGNMVYLDNNEAVRLSVEYFKKKDVAASKHYNHNAVKNQYEKGGKPKKKEEAKQEVKVREDKRDNLPQKPKTNKNEMSGQLSLFDL